jgi:tyrocidine synthetase-3
MDKLDKKNIEDVLALTPMQEGMLFHYLKDPDSEQYFEQLSLEISGKIDKEIFEKAWNFVIETNEMLRAVFRWEKVENPVQIILKEHRLQPRYFDFQGKSANDAQNQLDEIKVKDREQKFDLQEVPFRVTLCKTGANKYEMIISNHHILYDGWSNGTILKEFFDAYANLSITPGNEGMKEVKTRFKEFLSWIFQQDSHKQKIFWSQYLGDFDTPTLLPIKKSSNDATLKEVNNYSIILEKDTVDRLEVFTASSRLTWVSVFYGAWGLLLQRYCNSEDVIFGITVSGRPPVIKGIEDMVGLFINTLPLRVQSHDSTAVMDLLLQLDLDLQEWKRFEHTPLVEINQSSAVSGGTLFDTLFVIENYPIGQRLNSENSSLTIDGYSAVEKTHYDLTVTMELSEGIKITFTYGQGIFAGESIVALGGHFIEIVKKITANPVQRVHRLEIITEREKKQILLDFNDTVANYPRDKMIHHLFERQVEIRPYQVALVGPKLQNTNYKQRGTLRVDVDAFGEIQLSYSLLNEESNRLAYYLIEKGIRPDTIVGIMIERSVEMIIGILGILKAGAAYLPIDPDYPQERIDYMFKDSGVKVLVTSHNLPGKLEELSIVNCQLLMVNEESTGRRRLNNPPKEANLINNYQLTINNLQLEQIHLAYIIYTSGSTGKPKGVMIEQGPVINLLSALQRKYPLGERDTYLLKTSYLFDVSVTELFGWFLEGGRLVILEPGGEKGPNAILDMIVREGVTHINFVPSMFHAFVEILDSRNIAKLSSLKYIFLAGEALPAGPVNRFRSLNAFIAIENLYGPTEAAVYAAWFSLTGWKGDDSIPIGMPLPNVKLYIFDKWGFLQPIGVPGELCIGGAGLARGYLNQAKLTGEKFRRAVISHLSLVICSNDRSTNDQCPMTNDRFHSTTHHSPLTIYRTGDLARWLSDGSIEFLGRMDFQVKVRGFRIELGEIESRLNRLAGIKAAVVVAKTDKSGDNYLCAYIVSDNDLSASVLNDYLSTYLPGYMVPPYFVRMEKIPKTPSGKIDREALPKPEFKVGESITAPRNEIEKKLVEIWAGVLGIEKEKIGINNNFFHLGGHSLKAIILVSRIHKEFDICIPIPLVFKTPYIGGLAAFIKNARTQLFFSIEALEKKEYYILSAVQKRLLILQQMDENGTTYNMPGVWQLEGKLDVEKFKAVFRELILRHESLRMSFHMVNEEPVQRIDEETVIGYWSLVIDKAGESEIEDIIKNFIKPFDLSRAPLLRVGLIEQEEGKTILMVDMHHIIADGTSIGILQKEAMTLYRGIELPFLRIHYKEYAGWQKNKKNREALSTQEKFWLSQFKEEIEVLNLPTDYARPSMQSFEGDHLYFEISEEETLSLKNLMWKQDVTLYMVLLAVCNTWFSKLSGSEDIVIGSPIAGRRHDDLQDIIGMFVNTLALRNYPEPGKTFSDFLKEVKARTLEAFQNQDYQFEDLVDRLISDRDTSRNPVFDVMLVFQNMETPGIEIPGLVLIPCEYENKTSKFDLNLSGMEKEGKLTFDLEYSTKLFKEETVRGFIAYLKNIINFILENPEARISDVEIMSEEEKERILEISNGITVPIDAHETIHGMFEKIVKGNEDKTALVLRDSRVTYGELNRRANRLAYMLRSRGIRPDYIMGLMMERSFQLVISILAILKAGGAYLPIDSNYPWERKKYMLLDSEVSMLLTDYDIEDTAGLISNNIDVISPGDEDIYFQEEENSGHNTDGSNLVYLIYTSGSTGEPKGIMMEHHSLVNLLTYQYFHTSIPFKRVLQFTTISFDVSFQEIFSTLLAGGILYLVDKETRNDIPVLFEVINKNEIKTLFLPASFLKFVMNEKEYIERMPTAVRHIVTAGEQVVVSNRFEIYLKENRVWLHNHYGPAETHVVTTLTLDPSGEIPELPSIGKPVSNTGIFILDKARHLQPVGITGELFIGGDCLSRGYLNRPGLTCKKFKIINYILKIQNESDALRTDLNAFGYKEAHDLPLRAKSQKLRANDHMPSCNHATMQLAPHHSYHSPLTTHHSPLYQTGDLSRWREDGNIEFLGRRDTQVKIRGFRVELGEIESQLLKHSEIKEVVVVSREEKRSRGYLCGYFVAGRHIPPWDLREFLSKTLPDYMIPSYFIQLEKIPITPNGKIDRKALPVPVVKASDNYEAPRDGIEKKLVEIWSGVLGIEEEKIGINDNFFHLGGHSLKATVLVSRVSKELGVKVPLTEIFINPYIRRLATFVKNAETRRFFSIEAVEKKEYYILSSAQRRLLVLEQMDEKGIAYNMPSVWQLEGELNVEKFEAVFNGLIRRHESLRTSFHMVNEEPVQRIEEKVEVKVEEGKEEGRLEGWKDRRGDEEEAPFGQLLNAFGGSDNEGTRGFAPLPNAPSSEEPATTLMSSFIRPFDLSKAPLFRVGLIKLPHTPAAPRSHPRRGTYYSQEEIEHKYILMVDMHHIISDGMSIGILVKEFMDLYEGKVLPVLILQYKDYSEWQYRQDLEKSIKQQKAYWLKEFPGEMPVLDLPTDYPRPVVQDFTGSSISFEIGGEETNALKSLADEQGATLFMLLLSLYTVCLSRLSGQEDIVVGIPIAGRRYADIESIMGMFVNTLALRNFPNGQKSFIQFLEELKENTVKAFENQDYLYEDLVEKVEVERDTGRNPLFDTMFALQNFAALKIEIPGLKVQSIDYETRISKFDLTLTALESGENLFFIFEYCTKLFKVETIRRFIGYFTKTISTVIDRPGIRIADIEIIDEEEKNRIINEYNDTAADYLKEKTIHQLFEQQAERTSDHVALVGSKIQNTKYKLQTNSKFQITNNNQSGALRADVDAFGGMEVLEYKQEILFITYSELNRNADGLAHVLKEEGIKPDTIVGIMTERSVEMIIGIFGILKAGGAYMPIDPDYPQERIDYMLKDSGTKLLVTSGNLVKKGEMVRRWEGKKNFETVFLENLSLPNFITFQFPDFHLSSTTGNRQTSTSLAYVIYTSGTTGKPKGVAIEHNSLVNRLNWMQKKYPIDQYDTILQKTTFTFDVSVWEIFWWSIVGSKVCLLISRGEKDPETITLTVERHKITTMHFVPSMLSVFLDYLKGSGYVKKLSSLKKVIASGEALLSNHTERFNELLNKENGVILANLYGPTEATIDVSYFDCSKGGEKEIIPIGKPIDNICLYIVDKHLHIQPVGISGELCISGICLARGYLNRPELTAEKFVVSHSSLIIDSSKNSLIANDQCPMTNDRLYKTGDLARWLLDGNIEFLGRIDHQVKIRGFRIELGEIENRLLNVIGVKEAVVLAREEKGGDKYLCAYVVSDRKYGTLELREYLSKGLPDYMIPSYFLPLEKFPLTPSGKVDRKALPEPALQLTDNFIAPRNKTEEKMVKIWADVLSLENEKISITENFFNLGGHSLKATILVSRIHKEFAINIPLSVVFKTPYIRGLAAFIKNAGAQLFFSIEALEKKEYYILSSAQRRLLVLQQMDENGIAYNMPSIWQIEGHLDVEQFEAVFNGLIRRHESLRTSFHLVNDEPVQKINEKVEVKVEIETKGAPFGQVLNAFGGSDSEGTRGLPPLPNAPLPEEPATTLMSSFIRPFDLSKAPLFRVGLIKLPHTPAAPRSHPRRGTYYSQEEIEHKYILMVDMHHIISDGMSVGILVKEFVELYSGQGLPVLRLQYKDYSGWQQKQALEKPSRQQEFYWLKEFSGEIPVLDLPTDYARPSVQDFSGSSIHLEIDKKETNALKSLGDKQGVTLFMLLLSLYMVCLSRLGGQEDIVVGTPIAGRRHADLESIMGVFVNTLAIRNFPDGQKPFIQFLEEVKESTIKAFENQDYLYEDLVEQVDLERDTGRNPLFDTMFALQNFDALKIKIPGLKVQPIDYETRISKFDLTLTAVETGENLFFIIEYCTKLFKHETIRRFIRYFTKTISTVIDSHDIRISEIEIINEEEKNRILHEFNDTTADYPKDKTINRLFEEQVERTPDHVALVGPKLQNTKYKLQTKPLSKKKAGAEQQITNNKQSGALWADFDAFGEAGLRAKSQELRAVTYKELNKQSNRLAYILIEKGVMSDNIVGIMVERSVEMIVGIMGILKSGGAYLPIDSDYPQERIDYILKDSSSKILLTEKELTGWLSPSPEPLLNLSAGRNFTNNQYPMSNDPLAYIIYTSGSTGKPKGVMVEHSPVINLLFALQRRYPLGERDTFLLKTSYLFDVSVTELFGWFFEGGRLAVLERGGEKDPQGIINAIRDWEITHINFVPSMFNAFLEHVPGKNKGRLSSLKYIFLAGEALMTMHVDKFRVLNTNIELENIYGPTEVTVYSTKYSLSGWKGNGNIPIGKPLSNVKLYILDKWGYLQPIGVAGELCIGGVGLGRGYLNNPGLTSEKFVNSHLSLVISTPNISANDQCPMTNDRLYKTGDLTRWLSDGNIEFLGRTDHQVKIRGFRIELGDIENQLLTYRKVKEAVVLAREDNNDKYLCAYIVAKPGETNPIDQSGLREYLSERLPDYMVPSYFVQLGNIPLTPNGKIDRKAFPVPVLKASDNYEAPRDRIEKKLVEIWSGVLGIEEKKIGINDNFFHLGGHSLKATVIVSKIQKNFGVKIEIQTIFRFPTIVGVAGIIKSSHISGIEEVEKLPQQPYYEMSYAQKRLWYIYRSNPRDTAFNMPAKWTFFEPMDAELTRKVLERLMIRHESLRTSFKEVKEGLVQVIEPQDAALSKLNFDVLDLSQLDQAERENQRSRLFMEELSHIFNLEKGPHFRSRLVKCSGEEYDFIINIHHIAVDGWSLEVLKKEFLQVYESYKKEISCELEPLKIQYKDYAAWQNRLLNDEEKMGKAKEFWKNYLKNSITALNLPYDFSSKSLGTKKSSAYCFFIEEGLAEGLRLLSREQKVSLFMVFLAAFNILLSNITGQENIMIGIPAATRQHWSLQNIIGLFVNTLIVQCEVNAKETFIDFLGRFQTNTFNVLEYQDYPLEIIFGELKIKYPEISVFFNMLNIGPSAEETIKNFKSYHIEEIQETKFPIHCYLAEYKNGIRMECHYFRELFRPETIEKIMQFYTRILEDISESPLKKIKGLAKKAEKKPV